MLRCLVSLTLRSEGSVASSIPAAFLEITEARPHSFALIQHLCKEVWHDSRHAQLSTAQLRLHASGPAWGTADSVWRDDHASSAAWPQPHRRRRPDSCQVPLRSSCFGTQHGDHAYTKQGGAVHGMRGHSQHAMANAAAVHSSGSGSGSGSGSISVWSRCEQLRYRSTVVPGNGSKRKGEPADGNYKLSEVSLHGCISKVAS